MNVKMWKDNNYLNELKNDLGYMGAAIPNNKITRTIQRADFMLTYPHSTMYCCSNTLNVSDRKAKTIISNLLRKFGLKEAPVFKTEDSPGLSEDITTTADVYFLGYDTRKRPNWLIAGEAPWGNVVNIEKLESIIQKLN